jgi:hypothetical protein
MSTLAASYDLRLIDGPIRDQQTLGACTAFATTAVVDTAMRLAGHELPMLSTLAFYGEERDYLHFYNYDIGASGAAMVYASTQKGFVPESEWAYDPANLAVRPPADVTAQEPLNHATGWTFIDGAAMRVADMVTSVKIALSQGKALQLLFTPQSYFYNESGPLANLVGTGGHDASARHDVEIIGCDDNLNGGSYIIHNSWNTSWGDNGYGVIGYSQFTPNANYGEIQGFYTLNGFVSNGITYDFTYTSQRTIADTVYACVLGRPAEVAGLDWWASQISSGATQPQMIDSFLQSPEGQAIYGADTNQQFVQSVYRNVLNRGADSGGLSYWVLALETGLTHGALFSTMIDSVNKSKTDLLAHDFLSNKVNLAMYESVAMQYDGIHNSAEMSASLLAVTSDANSVEIIKVGLPHYIA